MAAGRAGLERQHCIWGWAGARRTAYFAAGRAKGMDILMEPPIQYTQISDGVSIAFWTPREVQR